MYQKVIVVGNLGADPEMKYLQSGDPVTNFSVATNRRYKTNSGDKVEEVTWFRVSVFGAQAEACSKFLNKGRQVLVEGRLRADPQTGGPRTWAGQDGVVRASYELTAESVQFLGQPGEQNATPAGSAGSEPDEIPF